MTPKIENAETRDHEQLRTLLIDAAQQLIGTGSSVLEPRLPWDGQPILLADATLHPVLISFDAEHSEPALLNGLRGVEQLSNALAWVNQVYDTLQQRQLAPKLVVVSKEFPPGAQATLGRCAELSLFRYRLLKVDGENAVWLENIRAALGEPRAAPETPAELAPQGASDDILPPLSEAESAYFKQL